MNDHSHTEPTVVELVERPTAVIPGVVDAASLPQFFDRAFPTLAQVVATQGAAIAGPAFAFYRRPPGADVDLEVGFPTAAPVEPAGEVRPGVLPGGRAAHLVHLGSYDHLAASWDRLTTWAVEEGLSPAESFWEVYVTQPTPDGDPARMRTDLFCLVAER